MNMPGFTAEASLFNVSTHYRATAEARFYGGIVQPAQVFSDVFNPTGICLCLGSECFCGPDLINAPFGAGGAGEFPLNRYYAKCRGACYRRLTGAALKACLEEC